MEESALDQLEGFCRREADAHRAFNVRSFRCLKQFPRMAFVQSTNRKSLRDSARMNAHSGTLYDNPSLLMGIRSEKPSLILVSCKRSIMPAIARNGLM